MNGRCAPAILAILALSSVARSQDLAPLVGQLRSGEPRQRMEAFYGILSQSAPPGAGTGVRAAIARLAPNNPALRAALIEALRIENAYVRQGRELGDDFSDYYGDLLAAVTGLRDPRAIPVLVEAMGTGNMVMEALAEFGQPAAEAVLERLNAGGSRRSACVVLGRMLEAGGAGRLTDPAVRGRIEEALMNASGSFSAYVRLSALEALTHSDNAGRRKLAVDGLQAFAEGSGGVAQAAAFHSLRLMAGPGAGGASPVQELAIQALGAIARRPESLFGPAAVTVLESVAKEGSPEARAAAGELLRGLEQADWLRRLLRPSRPREDR
jgi:hypothetical protein